MTTELYHICSYDNPMDLEYLESLIYEGSKIPISRFMNKHVLYCFVIPLKNNHRYIVIKFGYSEDIIDRINTLKTEYKSDVYLIRLKQITGQKDETKFHHTLKNKFPQLIENFSINDKNKTELYKLSSILIDNFDSYLNNDIPDDEPKKLSTGEQQIIDYVRFQETIFMNQLNKMLSHQIIGNKLVFDYLMAKNEHQFCKDMKEKEIKLKEKELQFLKEFKTMNTDIMKMYIKYNKISKSTKNSNL